jgi:tryptophan halogenase
MSVPDMLTHKMDLFRARGRTTRFDVELFSETGWLQIMLGQNLVPQSYNPLVDLVSEEGIAEYMDGIRSVIANCIDVMPEHAQYIAKHCAAVNR